jgi:hypothetical protein
LDVSGFEFHRLANQIVCLQSFSPEGAKVGVPDDQHAALHAVIEEQSEGGSGGTGIAFKEQTGVCFTDVRQNFIQAKRVVATKGSTEFASREFRPFHFTISPERRGRSVT